MKRNVARCWTYETAVLVGAEDQITDYLPDNKYSVGFASNPTMMLNLDKVPFEDKNDRAKMEDMQRVIFEHLRHLSHAPGKSLAAGQLGLLHFLRLLVITTSSHIHTVLPWYCPGVTIAPVTLMLQA